MWRGEAYGTKTADDKIRETKMCSSATDIISIIADVDVEA